MPKIYPDYAYVRDANDKLILNHYGRPIVMADYFEERHETAMVPASGGNPPVCACGWTREPPRRGEDGYELYQHQRDQAPDFQPLRMRAGA